jgi:hypothetical protein
MSSTTGPGRASGPGSGTNNWQLSQLQDDILLVAGVTSARIEGDDVPREIHIVAARGRPAKQIVRDVQSLASARFGLSIDHRIVSVVQLQENVIRLPDTIEGDDLRPRVETVLVANKENGGWVRVELRWPDGDLSSGEETSGVSRESRARSAAIAVKVALDAWLSKRNATLEIEHIVIQKLGSSDSVTVRLVIHEDGRSTALVGSALVRDDVASASVHATLHALNRKLR